MIEELKTLQPFRALDAAALDLVVRHALVCGCPNNASCRAAVGRRAKSCFCSMASSRCAATLEFPDSRHARPAVDR